MVHSFVKEFDKIRDYKGYREHALWYDCLNPTEEEKNNLAAKFKVKIPSQEKIAKIGTSNLFYKNADVFYLTTFLVARARSDQPIVVPAVFILHPHCLITVRYAEPRPFQTFKERVRYTGEKWERPIDLFMGLLETIVDRIAELAEKIDLDIDELSNMTFKGHNGKNHTKLQSHSDIITRLGKKGDLAAKMNESSRSLERLLTYIQLQKIMKEENNQSSSISILQQDVYHVNDHLNYLAHKINFLLDASLGYINIEQNNIMKTFTFMAIILLPPALIGTIYGMNFKNIPEHSWKYGYLFALFIMALSSFLPYLYFKRKRWL